MAESEEEPSTGLGNGRELELETPERGRTDLPVIVLTDSFRRLTTSWSSFDGSRRMASMLDCVAGGSSISIESLHWEDRVVPIDFLAHEDVALKAYFSTRRRNLDAVPDHYAFNQIGEVLPTILRDGRVVGRWRWNRRRRCVTVDLAAPDRGLVRVCAQRAERLTADLRRRHDGT